MCNKTLDLKAENREFNKRFISTIMPLIISSIFTQCLTFVDQWMVSTLGTAAIAAVGVSTNFFSVYFTFLYGCNTGAGIYLTRYWGKKDISDFQRILWAAVFTTLSVGILICGFAIAFPRVIIRLYNNDPLVMVQAVPYMRAVAISYILNAICFTISHMFRNMGRVKIPMIQGILSVLLNAFFNYIFIFGKIGFKPMGVLGAALGTLVTRIIEVAALLIYFFVSDNPVKTDLLSAIKRLNKKIFLEYLKTSLPLCANDMLWSLGLSCYYMVYGSRGTEVYAGMSIVNTMEMFAKLAIMGFAGTCTIILGIEIGKGDMDKVDRYAKRFNRISIIAGLISCSIILAMMIPIQRIYGISGTVEGECVRNCMMVLAVYCIPNAVNCIKVEGIFRSGGDVRYLTFMDAGSIWIIGMPITLILGLVFRADIGFVYAAHIAIELFKLPLGQYRLKSGKWFHNVTEAIDVGEGEMSFADGIG